MVAGTAATSRAAFEKVYDSQEDENVIPGTTNTSPWGELDGAGVTSWYLISAAPDAKIRRLTPYVSSATGSPGSYAWLYRIKIGPTQAENITANPDSQVSGYTTVHSAWNPSDTFDVPGWHDVDLQTPYDMCSSKHYIIKFEYVSGGAGSGSNAWHSTADRLPHDCYHQTPAGGLPVPLDYLPRVRMYGDGADLQVWSLTVTPDILWTGRTLQLALDVYNAGDVYIDHYYDVSPRYRKVGTVNWIEYPDPQEVAGHNALAHQILSWQFEWPIGETGDYEFQVLIDLYNEVVETDEQNNQLAEIPCYQAKDPPDPPITTLILADSSRMVSIGYSQTDVNDLMDDIDYLAQNDPHGKGLVYNLSLFFFPSSLGTARMNWLLNYGGAGTKAATDAYVRAIDGLIEDRHHYHYPDLERVLIVGTHEVIPMHVRADERGAGGTGEIFWTQYEFESDTYRLIVAGGNPGNYLTDAKYADLRYLDDAEESHLTRELVVGRLVETPVQISAIIDNYFDVSGTNPMDDIACIGSFEFKDGAYKAAADLSDSGYSADTTLIGDSFDSTNVPTKIEAKDDLIYIGGHGDYNNMATDAYRDAQKVLHVSDRFWAGDHASEGDTNGLASLPTAVIVNAGCHCGALFPNQTHPGPNPGTEYHDYPEEFASKGTIAYLGATGFTWITINDGDSSDTTTNRSEQLCSETVKHFAGGKSIGEAYRQAANEYYLDHKEGLLNRDRKVLGVHQVYGIPSYTPSGGGLASPGALDSAPGFHFENTTRQQFGSIVTVQTTLVIDSWSVQPDGRVLIPGANYTGGPESPVLPVIRYTEPNPVPPGTCVRNVFFDELSSLPDEFLNAVPTEGLAQRDSYVPAEPFNYPAYYPEVACSGFKILNKGGEDASTGLVIRPVQFNPTTGMTRVWLAMVLTFKYDVAQVPFYDSFAGGDLAKWTITIPDGSAASAELDHSNPYSAPYCLRIVGASAQGDRVKVESRAIDIDFNKPYCIECMFRWSSFHWDRFLIFGHVRLLLDQTYLPLLYDPVGDNSFVGNTIGPVFSSYAPSDTWMPVKVEVDPAARQYTIRINDTLVGTVTYQDTVEPSTTIWFEDNGGNTNYMNARYDEFLVAGGPPRPKIQSVWSVADHGSVGEVGLQLDLTASTLPDDSALVTTESRQAGITKLVIECDRTVMPSNPPEDAVASIVGVNNGDVTGNVLSVTAVGDVLTINLSELPDQDTYAVTLAGSVIEGDRDFMVRSLRGEVNNADDPGPQVVNALDLSAVRIKFTADVTVGDNAKYDIVSDGTINALDLSDCRIQFTHTAP